MKIVQDAKRAWKWFSVQAMVLATALLGAWEIMPDDLKAGIPSKYVTGAAMALLVLGVAGRLVKQGKP